MSSKKKSADDLRADIAALQHQIKEKSRQLREEDRRKEARQKFLLGELLQEWVKSGKVSEEELSKALETFLTRKEDRLLFGLEPEPSSVPVPSPAPDKTPETKPATEKKSSAKKAPKSPVPDTSPEKRKTPPQQAKPLKEITQTDIENEFEEFN